MHTLPYWNHRFHRLHGFKISQKVKVKSESSIQGKYLDNVLANFSGYIAADELYDGVFCVLFIVDNHKFKRLYIVEEVYRLFDRRCRTDTVLEKATQLRGRVSRFKKLKEPLKKLFSPNLEKALTFLDDSLLPSTSNAVERANRRHRKMQKSIYRVRTREHISRRIAIDMQRDAFIDSQNCTIKTLHYYRTGETRKTG